MPYKTLTEQLNEKRLEASALLDEVQAIRNLAETEERDFSEIEASRIDEVMGVDDANPGLHASLDLEIKELEKRERQMKDLAANRRQVNTALAAPSRITNAVPTEPQIGRVVAHAPRLRCWQGQDAARDAYMSGMWLRALIGRAWNDRDEAAEAFCEKHNLRSQHVIGDDERGGYTVPQPLARTLINILDTTGIARRTARIMPMTANTLDVPKKTDGVTVYYPEEAAPIAESLQTFANVPLLCRKRAVLSKVSQELIDDSIIPFMDDLIFQVGHDMAVAQDAEYINGDGTTTYGSEEGLIFELENVGTAGIITAGGTAWSDITFTDLTDLMGRLPDKYKQYETQFICSGAFYHSVMLPLLAQQGGSNLSDIQAGDRGVMRWLGYDVYLTHQMPQISNNDDMVLLYGAFQQSVIIGSRRDVTIAVSRDRYFEEDVTAVRSTARYDIEVHEQGDATTPGGYVGLKTALA